MKTHTEVSTKTSRHHPARPDHPRTAVPHAGGHHAGGHHAGGGQLMFGCGSYTVFDGFSRVSLPVLRSLMVRVS